MKFFRTLVLALSIAFAGTTAAHAQKVGAWEIAQDSDNCSAMASFEEGSIAYLGYFPSRNQLSVVILDNKAFESVEDGASFDAGLMFVDNAQDRNVEKRYATLPLTGTVLKSGNRGVLLDGPTQPLLDTFAKSEYFAIVRGETVLVSLHMENGPAVIAALRACMAKL